MEARELLGRLKARFEDNRARHPGVDWRPIEERLLAAPEKLMSLGEMEETGGEPDIIGQDAQTGEYIFCDCAPESPAGRRNLCYDRAALDGRRKNKPENSALDRAASMGIELLDERQYADLQALGAFDTKTSSWIKTPDAVRGLGGALFGDRRYNRVFVYHNGADSYYAARGFRGLLRL